MMMPSIALPTGPYDWHPERNPRAVYEARVEQLRAAMARRGATHAIVHGNIFDHGALLWLTHFTPKLGPAYALVPTQGSLRILFSGGPGMKPSAQKLTWVEDLAALRGIEGDVKRWLEETSAGATVRLGLVEGAAMLRGDWRAAQRAGGNAVIELDADVNSARATASSETRVAPSGAERVLTLACEAVDRTARLGADLRALLIEMEREVLAVGAQDVRARIGQRPGSRPTTPPDHALEMQGPTDIVLAVRYDGVWAERRFVLEPRS